MPAVIEEKVNINADNTTLQCLIAYDKEIQNAQPIVLVVPEWWGVTDFPKSKTRELAELGYFAIMVDIYGDGKIAHDLKAAIAFSKKFYDEPELAVRRINAALDKANTYPQADGSKTGAIGFCFGGSMVLNAAKLGLELDGVVSFHGGLKGVPPGKNIKSKILVCNGAADNFVTQDDIKTFKQQLDTAGVTYTFKDYPDSKHAFTNPAADENARKFNMDIAYNEEQAKNAWNDMKIFFKQLWN